ncbi:Putative cell wall binding repeat-containing protein [Lachnospiraceae bacterium NE2001]|nr:Putative cell wall binding repeat-containing protein [Lachnospiraceae bacterium NE2001]
MKRFRKITSFLVAASLVVSLGMGFAPVDNPMDEVQAEGVKAHTTRELTAINDINYKESLSDTVNPYRGFYKSTCLSYTRGDGNSAKDMSGYKNSLVHLRIDLSDFADHNGKDGGPTSDCEIDDTTTNLLTALEGTLQSLRENNATAVARIAYDKNYSGYTKDTWVKDDQGNDVLKKQSVWEPSIDTVLQNQQAVGEIFAKYPDVIASVECGVFGPWGEMHSSTLMTDETLSKVINKWLEVLPESITISVRQPEFYAKWSGVAIGSIDSDVSVAGTQSYRVGVYNDGYLGSYDDLGTFRNRDKEVAWLSNQAKHTLYGGEIVLFQENSSHPTDVQNNAIYMEKEAFKTHTSYLNIGWNDKVIQAMRDKAFTGQDSLYANGNTSELDYVQNHLGYRFVVRGVKLTKETTKYENFAMETEIENVGFANLIKEKKAFLVIKSADGKYEKSYDLGLLDASVGELASNIDSRYWDSASKTVVKLNVDIPDDFELGDYSVYIKLITSDNDHNEYGTFPIRFSNDDAKIFDETMEANYLGSFTIVEGELEEDNNNNDNNNNNNNNSNNDSNNNGNNNSNNNGNNNSNNDSNSNGNNNSNNSSKPEPPMADEKGENGNQGAGNGANGTDGGGASASNAPTYSSEWINGKWYNPDGTQTYEATLSWKCNSTGWWVEDTSGWYPAGQWQKIDGKWYYFTENGYMDYSEYRDGCWLGSDGAWVEEYYGGHWCKNSTGWWYEDSSGWCPHSQYLWIDGTEYYFKSDGYLK